jgi:hypothetical protein
MNPVAYNSDVRFEKQCIARTLFLLRMLRVVRADVSWATQWLYRIVELTAAAVLTTCDHNNTHGAVSHVFALKKNGWFSKAWADF